MSYTKSTHASNVDVHWVSLTREALIRALSREAGHDIPMTARIEVEEDGSVYVEWQTPKEKSR